MANLQPKTEWDFNCEGESLTELEHQDSTDINKMMRNALNGMVVRGDPSKVGYYWKDGAHDDLTMDAVQYRIQKEKLERDLAETAQKHEFEEHELQHIPESVQKKFNFKKKAKESNQPKTNEQIQTNDQKQAPDSTKA